jgi:methionyl-tRNA formyltransferase
VNIGFLTTDDPIYLPAFFERVLDAHGTRTRSVFIVPPLYKRQTPAQAAWRYLRTFGPRATADLARHVAAAKLAGRSISSVCDARHVPHAVVADVNSPAFLDQLRGLECDLLVSVSCPQIFKAPLIELPPQGILNIHGAILPHYRGVLPSFWMLANGERRAGVSIYFVNEAIDAGEVAGLRIFDILPDDTLDSFLRRSKAHAADLLLDVLRRMDDGTVERRPLDLAAGSYYSWPDRDAVDRFRAAGRRIW